MTQVATDTPSWTAYYRRDQWCPWRPVAEAGSENEALSLAMNRTQSGDLLILPTGQRPEDGRTPNRTAAAR